MLRRGSTVLCGYVDDLCAAGPQAELDRMWSEVRARFPIGKVEPCEEFLGIHVSRYKDGDFRCASIDLNEYAKTIVDTYRELFSSADWSESKRANFQFHKETPLPEWSHISPEQCPVTVPDQKVQKIIGMSLWLSRCGRPEIAYALSRIGARVSHWDDQCTSALEHCVGYVRRCLDREEIKLEFKVRANDANTDFFSVCYADANLDVPRSQSGFIYGLRSDRGTWCPIHWGSRKQSICCDSVAASELVAAHLAVREIFMIHELSSTRRKPPKGTEHFRSSWKLSRKRSRS